MSISPQGEGVQPSSSPANVTYKEWEVVRAKLYVASEAIDRANDSMTDRTCTVADPHYTFEQIRRALVAMTHAFAIASSVVPLQDRIQHDVKRSGSDGSTTFVPGPFPINKFEGGVK